ncbi:GAF domain-containing protein [Sodaliphilus sp.]|uniref:GAF domain-containing protein n=1 Tax=Sodaliphilus sp. TaxID=2815818 RepID=UPI00388D209F
MEKETKYKELLARLVPMIDGETNAVSVMANASALMREVMGDVYFWVGFYTVNGDMLELGPFQGTSACYRIKRGRGVCGTSWSQAKTLVVPDVEEFPGHIACSSLSRSEIVVPLKNNAGTVCAVLDIDSRELASFDDVDAKYLGEVAQKISEVIY